MDTAASGHETLNLLVLTQGESVFIFHLLSLQMLFIHF